MTRATPLPVAWDIVGLLEVGGSPVERVHPDHSEGQPIRRNLDLNQPNGVMITPGRLMLPIALIGLQ